MYVDIPVYIHELPASVPLDQALDRGMAYLSHELPRMKNWVDVLLPPPRSYFNSHIFLLNSGKDAFIGFIVSQQATFIPDILSEAIQIYGGVNGPDDTLNLVIFQRWVYDFVHMFMSLCGFRLLFSLILIINPYTFPWILIITSTDWFLDSLSGLMPVFIGVDFSGILGLNILAAVADYIKKIVFTMPYLPSEAIKETIGSHNVYRFSGIPQLWKEHGIPDQLREEWYKERPEIIEHFFKYYNDVNIDFLPSRVLQEFYKAQTAGSNLTSQVIDILPNNNISDLSYINISEFTNLLDLERFF
jgi:hypothetical protein